MLILLFIFNTSFAQEWVPKIWPLQMTVKKEEKVKVIPDSCYCTDNRVPVNCGRYIVCVKSNNSN